MTIPVELPASVDKALENLSGPITHAVGKSLADIWDLVFGPVDLYVEKKRLERQKDLQDFKDALFQSVEKIPEENLVEPKFSVVGPVLEASKFYFEEKDIREMFARLIAASMDHRYQDIAHPSFTEIIKQMTPLDAQNLTCFSEGSRPVVEYRLIMNANNGYRVLFTNVFLENENEPSLSRQASSISVLERLGLISTTYTEYLLAVGVYEKFKNTAEYHHYLQIYKPTHDVQTPVEIKQGFARLTPLGNDFIKVCLPEHTP